MGGVQAGFEVLDGKSVGDQDASTRRWSDRGPDDKNRRAEDLRCPEQHPDHARRQAPGGSVLIADALAVQDFETAWTPPISTSVQ